MTKIVNSWNEWDPFGTVNIAPNDQGSAARVAQ